MHKPREDSGLFGVVYSVATVSILLSCIAMPSFAQYSNAASHVGQGGTRSTSTVYQSFSSIRQDVNVGTSHGTNITHYGGFMSAFMSAPSLDTDGDGLADEVDPDNDNDGINDEDELSGVSFTPVRATAVNNPDTDADGMNDGDEAVAGNDPTVITSYFGVTNVMQQGAGPTNLIITIPTVYGRQYEISFAQELATTGITWNAFTANGTWTESNPSGGSHGFSDDFTSNTSGSPPSNGARFYRVQVSKP